MNIKTSLVLSLILFFPLLPGASSVEARNPFSPGVGDGGVLTPVVGKSVHFDLSPALSSIPVEPFQQSNSVKTPALLRLPKAQSQTALEAQSMQMPDPVLQNHLGSGSMPEPINSFDGVGNENLVLPPDTEGDIGFDPATGRKYYVQWVNLSFAIWDVTGAPTKIYGPVSGNTLWKGFGGPCENTNHGDPITLFDPLAQRWLMSQFSVDGPFYQCIAISQSGDPTGAWFRYAYLISSTKMNDYPHFGVWPDGYYLTVNQFNLDNSWAGTGVAVFDREKMLTGQQAGFQYFDLYPVDPDFGGMLPADLDGLNPPPAGAPDYFLEVDDASWIGPQDALRLWKFHVDWDHPENTTFGIAGQPDAVLPTADWTPLCDGVIACIPQPGTYSRLDAIGDRLMYRLAYRNFGDHEALVVNHTVNAGSGQAGVRWYEVRDPGGTPVLYQQGTFAPDLNNRWMGSIAQDRMGDIALGYSVASSSLYPSVRYTGRLAEDPTGLMTQGEATLIAGGGSQMHASARWGDYSLMSIDPVDDCTFWYTQEYYSVTSSSNWQTRIGSFRFPGCSDATPGKLSGRISDRSSGLPISGTKLIAASSSGTAFQTISDPDGHYSLLLGADIYSVSASAYGYFTRVVPDVQLEAGITTTLNISLEPTEKYVVSGTVVDEQTGWPLYARITILGDPMGPPAPYNQFWTDPASGSFSVTLAAGSDYQLQVDSFSPGYLPESYQTGVLTGDLAHDIQLSLDSIACSAPGYTRHLQGHSETFDALEIPSAWTLADLAGSGAVWRFNNPKPRPNYTGGKGNFAIIDSDYEGPVDVDTELLTPIFDLSSYPTATLEFKYDFNWYEYGQDERAEVDLSVDGGSTWTNIWQRFGAGDRGPRTARLDISSLAGGQSNVQVRFHYYRANFEWWWQVDDFFIGQQFCDPDPGGLVVGEVKDANTNAGIPGALVGSDTGNYATAAVSTDPQSSGALYTLFSPAGSHIFTATAGTQYGVVVKSADVLSGTITRLDFSLPAGWLQADPDRVDLTLEAGLTATRVITLSNQGELGANFLVTEVNAPLTSPQASGPFAPAERRVSPAHLYEPDARSVRIYEPPDVPLISGGGVQNTWASGLPGAWGIVHEPSQDSLWIGNIGVLKGDNWDHRFSQDGKMTGEKIDTTPWGGVFAAGMAYDPHTDRIWQVVVGSENCIHEWNPLTQTSTGRKICPDLGVSMRGLAYDPITDTFYSGSWNDQILYHFDSSGKLLDSFDVRLNIAGLALNPGTGHLFVLSNADIGFDIYVLDVSSGSVPIGGFDIPGLGAFEQAGLDLDCAGNLWTVNQATSQVIKAISGETGVCTWSQVPWLSVSPLSGSLAPSGRQALSLNFDAGTLPPGAYPAYLQISSDTPYSALDIPITLTVRLAYDFSLAPESAQKTGAPGEQITIDLLVENTGLQTDEYQVELQNATWPVEAADRLGPLAPGETEILPVTVLIPVDTGCNSRDDFTVVLTSIKEPKRTASANLGVAASLICGLDLQPSESNITSTVGEETVHLLRLTNTGNITDTFNLTIENNASGWKVFVSPNSPEEFTLAPSTSLNILVHVFIPKDALPGQINHVTIRVGSRGDASQINTSKLVTQVIKFNYYFPMVYYH